MRMNRISTRTIAALLVVLALSLTACTTEIDTQLMLTARKGGKSPRVRTLLNAGADANAVTRRGFPVLVYAAALGDTETVQALVEAGAQIDRSNRGQGRTQGHRESLVRGGCGRERRTKGDDGLEDCQISGSHLPGATAQGSRGGELGIASRC